MGTRSRIGRQNSDGTITSIYVHFDGYIDHVGALLLEHYTDPAKIGGLLDLGDCSCLEREITRPEGHAFGRAVAGHTVAYGRDRGEVGTEAVTHGPGEWPDSAWEYRYLWREGAWWVSIGEGPFLPLAAELRPPIGPISEPHPAIAEMAAGGPILADAGPSDPATLAREVQESIDREMLRGWHERIAALVSEIRRWGLTRPITCVTGSLSGITGTLTPAVQIEMPDGSTLHVLRTSVGETSASLHAPERPVQTTRALGPSLATSLEQLGVPRG